MVHELMASFHGAATGIGILSAFFLYAYAPMQLPVGLLIDRYGIRRLLPLAALLCGAGSLLFSLSPTLTLAAGGRFLIGLGSAFAFVAMVYISSHRFNMKKRALLIGVANSIAMLGASFGGGPLSSVVSALGWREAMCLLGIFGFGLAFLIFRTAAEDDEKPKVEPIGKSLRAVFFHPPSWINGLVAICIYITTTAFAGLWGASFIETAYSVSPTVASYAMSMVFLGWLVGGPLIGYFAGKTGRPLLLIRIFTLLLALTLSIVLYVEMLPLEMVFLLTFLIGLFSSAELLNFTIAIELAPPFARATALAFTNFIVSLGDGGAQSLVGFLLDMRWTGGLRDGLRFYSASDYRAALTFLPVMLIFGAILSLFVLPRYHRRPKSENRKSSPLPVPEFGGARSSNRVG